METDRNRRDGRFEAGVAGMVGPTGGDGIPGKVRGHIIGHARNNM